MLRLLVLALVIASTSAGLALPRLPLKVLLRGDVTLGEPKINDGTEAEEGEFPWQVSLRLKSELGTAHFCGGSVGDEDTVITVSHCIYGTLAKDVYIAAGVHQLLNRSDNEQLTVASELVTHPEYSSSTFFNDIAIVKLSSPLTYTRFVQPVRLSAAGQVTSPGTVLTVTGWGTTAVSGYTNTLLKMDVPVVSDDDCRAAYAQDDIAESMICAGSLQRSKASCQNDSGSPLVNEAKELIGIVSWGYGCFRPARPGVYTETAYFVDWIISHF